jgi:argininosuccinate synthase
MAKCVLAYSGGLDTSVCLKWIADKKGLDVIALSVDVGEERDYEGIRQKAENVGAIKALVVDAKEEFFSDFISRAIKANLLYEGRYSLSHSVNRVRAHRVAAVNMQLNNKHSAL